ncbi:hypothetical protein PHAGEALMA_232 [Escherichia phage vB_Eco_Alma]|nr:hypothetical protein PHAGEALMA_232 [Escherichia phage vB_Eco_Alma]
MSTGIYKICKCGCHCNLRWCKALDDFIWHCPECDARVLISIRGRNAEIYQENQDKIVSTEA